MGCVGVARQMAPSGACGYDRRSRRKQGRGVRRRASDRRRAAQRRTLASVGAPGNSLRSAVESDAPLADAAATRPQLGRSREACGGNVNRTETIHEDPTTGGLKGSKLARFDLIPAGPLVKLAEHYGIGARKYEDRNWERGYAWSLSFGAMMRHAWLWWSGEDDDPESGDNHLVSVAWHAFALLEWAETRPEH